MWYLKDYDPIQAGSIDGTDTEPHDAAIDRATQSQYRPPHHLKTDPNCTVFVGRLSFDTVESGLKVHFEKYGEMSSVSVVRNQVTGLSQGYGFVSFKLEKDARRAYKEANRSVLDDHVILVDFERSRVMKDWIPRRLGGGFGGKKDSGQLRFGARDRPFKAPASSHVRIPCEQKFSDTWRHHHSQKKPSRSKSPSRFHHRSESNKRRRSRSPSEGRSRHSSRRPPSNDRHQYSHKYSSSSNRYSSHDRHKRRSHEYLGGKSSGSR